MTDSLPLQGDHGLTLLDTSESPVKERTATFRIAASLFRTGESERRIRRLMDCDTQWYLLRSKDDPSCYRWAKSRCRDKHCPRCQSIKSRVVGDNLVNEAKGKSCRLMTLTLKHRPGESLSSEIQRLYRSFRRLRGWSQWREKVKGSVGFCEVTRNKETRSWHVHLHIIAEGLYWEQKDLSREWLRATGDSSVVDIRMIRNAKTVGRYVTKYVSKSITDGLDDQELDEFLQATKNVKQIITTGDWRKAKLTMVKKVTETEWMWVGGEMEVQRRAREGDDAMKVAMSILRALRENQQSIEYEWIEGRMRSRLIEQKGNKEEVIEYKLW